MKIEIGIDAKALTEEYVAKAAVSEDGNTVVLGEYTATRYDEEAEAPKGNWLQRIGKSLKDIKKPNIDIIIKDGDFDIEGLDVKKLTEILGSPGAHKWDVTSCDSDFKMAFLTSSDGTQGIIQKLAEKKAQQIVSRQVAEALEEADINHVVLRAS